MAAGEEEPGRRGVDAMTLAAVEQYGVERLLHELAVSRESRGTPEGGEVTAADVLFRHWGATRTSPYAHFLKTRHHTGPHECRRAGRPFICRRANGGSSSAWHFEGCAAPLHPLWGGGSDRWSTSG